MHNQSLIIDGVRVPCFLYGTAWKEQETQRLTELSLLQGFRGIDTANQRRHYDEAAVGRAVAAAVEDGLLARSDLFLQTKFTFRRGQDHRLPYDPRAPIAAQVEQSFASSIEHLGVEVIDSFLLHGPTQCIGLAQADWEAWRTMEIIQRSGRARLLVSAMSPSSRFRPCAARHKSGHISSRTDATPSGAGTVTFGCSALRMD